MKLLNILFLFLWFSQTLHSQEIINEKLIYDENYSTLFGTNYAHLKSIRLDSNSFLTLINQNGVNNLTKYSNSLVPVWSTTFTNADTNYFDDLSHGSIRISHDSIICYNPTELYPFSYSYGLKRSIVDLNGNLLESKVMNSKNDTIIGFGYDVCDLGSNVLANISIGSERSIIEFDNEGRIIKKINADSILNSKLLSLLSIRSDNEDIYLSGFISDSNQPDNYRLLVSRVKTNYNPIWIKTYDGFNPDKSFFNQNIILKNNSSVYSITVYNSESKRAECLLLFYDHEGNLTLQKSFGFASYTYIYKLILNNDGSYLAFGSTGEKGDLAQNNLFFKMDQNGDILWTKTWTPEYGFMSYISDAICIDSNTYCIFGRVAEKYKSKVYIATLKDTTSIAGVYDSKDNTINVSSHINKNILNISFPNSTSSIANIEIFDINGNSVTKVQCNNSFVDIETSGLASGIYFIVVEIDGQKNSGICLIEK